MTARVLGLVVFMLALLIDSSCFIFARPEMRSNPRFIVVVILSSLPMYVIGALLLRKASRMKDTEEDEPRA